MTIEYRPIPGLLGYSAGNDGTIWSHKIKIGKPEMSDKRIRQIGGKHTHGHYVYVSIHNKSYKVHHLILQTFIGPRPSGMEACHYDGNGLNNRVENLRWDTRKNNHADKKRHGTARLGEENDMHILTADDVAQIKRLMIGHVPATRIAIQFGVHYNTILDIQLGKTWGWLNVEGWYPRKKQQKYSFGGEMLTIPHIAKLLNVCRFAIYHRMRRGLSFEEALEVVKG